MGPTHLAPSGHAIVTALERVPEQAISKTNPERRAGRVTEKAFAAPVANVTNDPDSDASNVRAATRPEINGTDDPDAHPTDSKEYHCNPSDETNRQMDPLGTEKAAFADNELILPPL